MTGDQGHLVLARKYRPRKFGEVIGQQPAVRALTNAIIGGRLGSAYIFFGPRGVGKTTMARLLAKRANCLQPRESEPCDECEACKTITAGNSLDVLEIDAASHRGIQHIRELRENVKFQPMASKMKIYIIDEVHMLTTESFNALLKTLEEPPAHAIFVLATTEFNKVPETIRSRCQVFTFRKIALQPMQDYLLRVCRWEGLEAEEEALFWIARRGDGSIRDCLSFMEQAITYCAGKLETTAVRELIGAIPFDTFKQITLSLLDENSTTEDLVRPVHEIFTAGGDLNRLIWEYLDFMRILIHIRRGVESVDLLGIPGPEVHQLRDEFRSVDATKLEVIFNDIFQVLSRAGALRLRNSYETRVLIEISLLALRDKLARPSLSLILQRLNQLSAAIGQGRAYSSEAELQKQFLGTAVDPDTIPRLE